MKKFATLLPMIAAALLVGTAAFVSDAQASSADRYFGPEVPLPHGSALPFPYKDMDGYWEIPSADGSRVFVMKSSGLATGSQAIRVIEFDPLTGREIARGVAKPVQKDSKVLKAQMLGRGTEYELFMGVYPDLTLPKQKPRTVFAVRAPSFDNGRSQRVIARKIGKLRH